MTQTEFQIEGMTCAHCERAISEALAPLAGVSSTQVNAEKGTATVEHDDRLDAAQVAAAVIEAGYAVRA